MRIALIAALLLTAAAPVAAQDKMVRLEPEDIGTLFCIGRLGNDMEAVGGIISTTLATWIADADLASAEWEEANPGEKPPLGDGIPWQSFPDYAQECTTGNITIVDDHSAEVEIRYGFHDQPDAGFSDTLLLMTYARDDLGTNVWRVENVRYQDGTDLLKHLAEIAAGED